MANWETLHNNFAGMRIPGVYAGPNSGGFQSFDTPDAGLYAISRQLDRYASGATTGAPLNTLRSMINTWAPPSDNNPTNQLIQRAASVTGLDPDKPLDVSDPGTKAALIEAFIRNEQGGSLPVDRNLISKVASTSPPATAATGNNKNMAALPPFGNARALASLMPATATPPGAETVPLDMSADVSGASAMGAGGAGDITTPLAAPKSPTGYGYYDVGSNSSPAADPNDPMSTIKALMSSGLGSNPSKMLANMSAGFFGGNGSLGSSLAGGFGGLAKSQQEDQSEMGKLAQMAMMYGPLLQQKITQQKQSAAAALTRSGTPIGTAYKAVGLPPPDGETYDSLDAQSRAAMPLPATAQKTVQDASSNILTQRNNQIQLKTIRDQVANGDFNLDLPHRKMYEALNAIGMPTEASSKYQAMQQTLGNMQSDLMNAQKGASSDKRADLALSQLTGGGGLTSNAQAVNHFDYLGNHAALAEKNLRQKMQQAYTLSKQKMPADFMDQLDGTLPASPYQSQDPNVIGRQLYGDNTTNPNATAAPGQPLAGNVKPVVPSLKTTPSGVKYQIINP